MVGAVLRKVSTEQIQHSTLNIQLSVIGKNPESPTFNRTTVKLLDCGVRNSECGVVRAELELGVPNESHPVAPSRTVQVGPVCVNGWRSRGVKRAVKLRQALSDYKLFFTPKTCCREKFAGRQAHVTVSPS